MVDSSPVVMSKKAGGIPSRFIYLFRSCLVLKQKKPKRVPKVFGVPDM